MEASNDGVSDIHPIELIAHSLLSGSLDTLGENFDQLNQSQLILLTRLNIIEQRLQEFKQGGIKYNQQVSEELLRQYGNKVQNLKRRLLSTITRLDKIDKRIDTMDCKLN